MYYLGMLHRNLKDVLIFRAPKLGAKERRPFVKVLGPYKNEQAVKDDLVVLKKMYGYRENPAVVRSRKKVQTSMSSCRKHNPPSCGCSMSSTMKKLTYIRKVGAKVLGKEGLSSLLKTLATKEDIASAYKMLARKPKVRKTKKNPMTAKKALALTKKVMAYAEDLRKTYKENPGQQYHDQKFLMYMKELEKYKLGSVPYIGTLAKAYEHLESAKESMRG